MTTPWGVGRVGPEWWPVSADDVEDEAQAATAHLRAMGAGPGTIVLLVSKLSEAVHVAPLERAAELVGARFSSADATVGDAFRTAALVRLLSPVAVVGVSGPVVEGLADPLAEVLGPVAAVVTSDDAAHGALSAAGLAPRRWLKVGPTSAFECEARAGAHLDGTRWRAEAGEGGELLLTSLAPRLRPCDRLATGVRADVVEGRCACGRGGPRLVPRTA
jgi:hypothetical protein